MNLTDVGLSCVDFDDYDFSKTSRNRREEYTVRVCLNNLRRHVKFPGRPRRVGIVRFGHVGSECATFEAIVVKCGHARPKQAANNRNTSFPGHYNPRYAARTATDATRVQTGTKRENNRPFGRKCQHRGGCAA